MICLLGEEGVVRVCVYVIHTRFAQLHLSGDLSVCLQVLEELAPEGALTQG